MERFIYQPGGGQTEKGKPGNYQCTACGKWFANESSVTLHWYWMTRKGDPRHGGASAEASNQAQASKSQADQWRRAYRCPKCGGELGRLSDISNPGADVHAARQAGGVVWCKSCREVFTGRLEEIQ